MYVIIDFDRFMSKIRTVMYSVKNIIGLQVIMKGFKKIQIYFTSRPTAKTRVTV